MDIRNVGCYNLLDVSLPTISRLRKIFSNSCRGILEERFDKIGGVGKNVQVDEMGFRRGSLISNPTSDTFDRDTLWIIGGIEEDYGNNKSKFFIVISQYRDHETMGHILKNHIKEGTNIKSDGYPSYPPSIRLCNRQGMSYTHEVVNHNQGFKNAEGVHTNNIENLWSHLRYCWRGRKGVIRSSLEDFLYEFIFFKIYIDRSNRDTVKRGFYDIIKESLKFLN